MQFLYFSNKISRFYYYRASSSIGTTVGWTKTWLSLVRSRGWQRNRFTATEEKWFVATSKRKLAVSNHRFLRFREGTDTNELNQRNNCRRKLLSYDTVGSCTSRTAPWRINIDVETTVIDVTITFSRLTRRCLWLQSDAEDKLSEKSKIKSYKNYLVTSLLCYASDREPIKIDSCLIEMKKVY